MSCSPTNIITVHQHDVLFGRGGKNCKHAGNQRLRAVARSYKNTYSAATKKGKSDISRSIVAYFRGLDPPGRFLKKDDATGLWVEVKEEVAREKASQTLRDARDDPVPVDDGVGGGGDRHGHPAGDTYHNHQSGYLGDDDYYHPAHAVTSSWEQAPHHHHRHYERPHHHHRHSGHESWRHHHPASSAAHHLHPHNARDVRLPILDGRRAKVWIHQGGGNRDRHNSEEDASYSHRNDNRIVLPLGGRHSHADAEVESYVGSHEEGTVQVQGAGDGYEVNPANKKRRYHQAIQDDQEQAFRSGGPNRSSSSDFDEDNAAGAGGNRIPHSHYYHTVTPPENSTSAPSRYDDHHHQTDDSGRFYETSSNSQAPGSRPPSVPIEPSNSFEYAPHQQTQSSSHGGGCDEVRPSGGGGSNNTVFAASSMSTTTSVNHHVAFPTPDSHCPVSSSSAPENWAKNEAGGGGGGGEWNDGYEYVERYSSSAAGATAAHH